MADNTPAVVGTGDTIRDKDRSGVKTQIFGLDLTIGGASETLMNGTMPVHQFSSAAAMTNVAAAVADTVLLALNTARIGATVYNDSTSLVYVKLGTGASATSYTVQIAAGGYWECPYGYTGAINGFWVSANGNARISELS